MQSPEKRVFLRSAGVVDYRLFLSFPFILGALMILPVVLLVAGCGSPPWETVSPPDIRSPTALASVQNFIATKGWHMFTNQGGISWDDLSTNLVISGLPWTNWSGRQFQAVTRDGILFVLWILIGITIIRESPTTR
jgi:hypothetical protein